MIEGGEEMGEEERKEGGGKIFKTLVVLAILGGLGYFAYVKGYHKLVMEKCGLGSGDGAETAEKSGEEAVAGAESAEKEASAGEESAAEAETAAEAERPEASAEEEAKPEEAAAEEAKPEEDGKKPEEAETIAEDRPFTGYEWVNVTPSNRIGGRMVSPGYLRGKTVLIDCRDYGSRSCVEDAKALQQLWSTYKSKEFVVIGCHTGEAESERVAKIMDRLGLTYPIYRDAGLLGRDGERLEMSTFTVLDSTGRRFMHRGSDIRRVTGVIGNLIFITKRPSGAKSWKWLLDWEIENMPGHAYNRLRDFNADTSACAEMRKKHPKDFRRYADAYADMKRSDEVLRTAKLVALAVAVKDRDVTSASAKRITKATLAGAIEKYSDLKGSEDPRIVQEAKNAIADLTFAAASMKN